jgi:hypothetical protein
LFPIGDSTREVGKVKSILMQIPQSKGGTQMHRASGNRDVREEDHEREHDGENGIGDADGLMEQTGGWT